MTCRTMQNPDPTARSQQGSYRTAPPPNLPTRLRISTLSNSKEILHAPRTVYIRVIHWAIFATTSSSIPLKPW